MLLGIRCRLAGIPFESHLVHMRVSNTKYCSSQQDMFSASVQAHLRLPVAHFLHGSEATSRKRDAGRR
jgi:hypothetical protein